MYLTVGSGIPDAVFKRIFGTDFSMMLVICATLDCANKDMDEPESSITSKVECPMFPIVTAVCILVVANTTVCVCGCHLIGMLIAPQGHPLLVSRLPAVGSNVAWPATDVTSMLSASVWTISLYVAPLLTVVTLWQVPITLLGYLQYCYLCCQFLNLGF